MSTAGCVRPEPLATPDAARDPGVGAPGVRIDRDVAVPMRDDVVLRADVYRPDGPGPYPVLVFRTPYGKHFAAQTHRIHLKAVERGYAVVLQDVRGRYASGGQFNPYGNEGRDGYDSIEWAAGQHWSNGKIGTFGLSYPGAVQWLAAMETPPHLVSMVPAMTFSSPRNFFYMNGVFDLSWLPWIYTNVAPDARRRLDLPGIRDEAEAEAAWAAVADEYRGWRPLRDLPYLRREAPFYFEWLAHPPEDPWWDWAELRGRYSRVSAAVLNLSGWHDEAYGPEGAVTNFNGLLAARAGERDPRAWLVLGPWVHGVGSMAARRTGDIDFGPVAAIDYDDLVLDFHDRHLRGIDNEFATSPRVRHFVMGANEWQSDTTWPPSASRTETLYLAADAGGQRRLQSAPPRGESSGSSFTADPDEPVTDPYGAFGPHDYRSLEARGDVLTFDSAPLDDALQVSGAITAEIHASCDCRDFDLWVRLLDVYPDGRAITLMSPGNDVIRASYRDPARGRQPLEPGRVYALRLLSLMTSNVFGKGHRIRVQISASFAPHFSRNLQTGESEVVAAASRVARITIHHGAAGASSLLLPVAGGTSEGFVPLPRSSSRRYASTDQLRPRKSRASVFIDSEPPGARTCSR
jgi:putative CocE/NonD family hydrolase